VAATFERPFTPAGKRIWVAGHRGMVGSALVRRLERENCEILTAGREELDLLRQAAVEDWLQRRKPDAVIIAAARVGGIHANASRPAEFLYENLAIQSHIIHGAFLAGVTKLLFLGSSCIYPRLAEQPMREEALLTGPLEPTNQWYAVAKIAGIRLCQAYRREHGCDFISAMPTNLYGPNDNYDLESGHVPAALMVKMHRAQESGSPEVEIWGTGGPLREFMHVDDLADALVFLLRHYSEEEHINVGSGQEVSIREFAEIMADVVGYRGELRFDRSRPDGAPRKLLDCTRLYELGWRPRISLRDGLLDTYRQYRSISK
jgi:GDP-L-fucose synthase